MQFYDWPLSKTLYCIYSMFNYSIDSFRLILKQGAIPTIHCRDGSHTNIARASRAARRSTEVTSKFCDKSVQTDESSFSPPSLDPFASSQPSPPSQSHIVSHSIGRLVTLLFSCLICYQNYLSAVKAICILNLCQPPP